MFKKLKNYFRNFCHEEDGSELVEYAIVIAIVAVLAAAVLIIVGTVQKKVESAGNEIAGIPIPTAGGVGSVGGTGG